MQKLHKTIIFSQNCQKLFKSIKKNKNLIKHNKNSFFINYGTNHADSHKSY